VTQTLDQEVLQFSSRADASEILAGPLRVAELMTSETTSMSADQTFGELVTMMANRSFHHVLVVDGDKNLCGVISDRDVLRVLARSPQWHSKQLSEIMTQEPVTTTPDMLISASVREMLAKRINLFARGRCRRRTMRYSYLDRFVKSSRTTSNVD
jgi:predicted transcriptional regulator